MRRLVLAILLGVVLLAQPAAAQDAPEPTLTTERGAYDRGQLIRVEGEGWPARTLLTVELCGNEAANGSVDCDARNATTAATTADGVLFVDLLATAPPSPCPCVVHVFTPSGTTDLGVRVRIEGVPYTEVTTAATPERMLEVTDVELTRTNGLATWFGAAPVGTLRVAVTNTGEVPVHEAALRLRWGRSAAGTRAIDADHLGTVAPGETVEVEVPIRMDPVPFGRFVVSADVAGFASSADTASMSAYPVGLILLLVLVAVAIGGLRVRRRSRRVGSSAPAEPSPAPVVAPAAVVAPIPPAPEAPAASDDADDEEPLGMRKIPTAARAALGLAVIVALGLTAGMVRGCSDGDGGGTLTDEELCAELQEIDPGRSFGGESAERLAAAAARVHDIEDRAPEAVAGAVGAIATEVDEDDAVLDLSRLEQGDDGYTQAYQAAYALRFDSEIAVAAALLEQYGVDECGMAPSGAFDIDAVRASDLDAADTPVLTQDEIDALRVEFTPADVDGFALEPFEIPEVEFEEDLDQFQLDIPEIPQPTFGP